MRSRLPSWLVGVWILAFPLSIVTPGILPTVLWLLLMIVGLIVGLIRRVIPLGGALLMLISVALIVMSVCLIPMPAMESLGMFAVTLFLGVAALAALALRLRLRRAVTIPNILVSGGLGIMVGMIATTEINAHLLRPETRGRPARPR